MIKRIIGLIVVAVFATAFSWPTPVGTPVPFVGITTQPTPVVALPQAQLCFEDYAISQSVTCGQNFVLPAGDTVLTGMSVGSATNGTPQGPWPATVTLVVNGVKYSSVPVNQTTGWIGWATVPGSQYLSISILGTSTLLGTVQTVTTQ